MEIDGKHYRLHLCTVDRYVDKVGLNLDSISRASLSLTIAHPVGGHLWTSMTADPGMLARRASLLTSVKAFSNHIYSENLNISSCCVLSL
jgi:hypothetical protein